MSRQIRISDGHFDTLKELATSANSTVDEAAFNINLVEFVLCRLIRVPVS